MVKRRSKGDALPAVRARCNNLLPRIPALLEQGRQATVPTTNAILAAAYWEGRRQIVEYEQGGQGRVRRGTAEAARARPDRSLRPWFRLAKPLLDASLLPWLGDFADTVGEVADPGKMPGSV